MFLERVKLSRHCDKMGSGNYRLEKKDEKIDVSQYQEGQKVYHKKFGEGIINKLEPEGDDFKVDISFEKSGNKRLMAKFAGLQIID